MSALNKTVRDTIVIGEDQMNIDQELNRLQKEKDIITAKLTKNTEQKNRADEAANKLKEQETGFEKLLEKTRAKRELSSRREIEDLGKTELEMRKLAMARKIEDALLAKKITDQGIINRAIQEESQNIELLATRTQKFNEIQRAMDGIADGVSKTFETTGNKIFDAFARGEAGALNFKDVLRQVLIDIQKTLFQVLVMDRITKAIREGISGSSGLSGFIGSLFTSGGGDLSSTMGSTASGGSVQQSGVPRMVGERGPELFVPGSAGVIKNNADTRSMMGGGGGGVNITQNLNFALGVTNTVRSEIANMLPTIQQSTISAVADAKLRGGKFAKAFGG